MLFLSIFLESEKNMDVQAVDVYTHSPRWTRPRSDLCRVGRHPECRLLGCTAGVSSDDGATPYSKLLRIHRAIHDGSNQDCLQHGPNSPERSRGTWEQNREYCTKAETREAGPWEHGQHLAQGRRSDLGDVAAMVLADIAWIRYGKGVVALRADVHVFVRSTGTGKSRAAHAEAGESVFVLCDPTGKWWDGYASQETVIIDDLRGEIQFTCLLKLLDRYPMQVQTKGGWTNLSARHWFITSNLPVVDWYGPNIDIAPLRRRISEIRNFI